MGDVRDGMAEVSDQRYDWGNILKTLLVLFTLQVLLTIPMTVRSESGDFANDDIVLSLAPAWIEAEETNSRIIADYINKAFYGTVRNGAKRVPRDIGNELIGGAAHLYQKLRTDIQLIASGKQAVTVFSYDAQDIYPKTQYTSEELGLDAIYREGALTEEARNAAMEILHSIDEKQAIYALRADCPYELYWAGTRTKISFPQVAYNKSSDMLILRDNVTVSIEVVPSYRKDPEDSYLYDVSYGTKVGVAVENAKAIVEKFSDLHGIELLNAYRDTICDFVTYNYDALEEQDDYGDPWQLVYVFDDDPDTNVVCEGYSKAFQYLMDMSDFEGTCYTPSGTMNGAHMWNVVRWEGENYLVDLTNCDSGMAGYPDKLFMAKAVAGNVKEGYSFSVGNHNLTYIYNEATQDLFSEADLTIAHHHQLYRVEEQTYCTENGTGTYMRCKLCEKLFDIDGEEISEVPVVGPTGHFWYLTDGPVVWRRCAKCGEEHLHDVQDMGNWLYLPTDLEEIEEEAFFDNRFAHVIIPEGTMSIGDRAFASTSDLISVYVPATVTRIGTDAFDADVVVLGEEGSEAARLSSFVEREHEHIWTVTETGKSVCALCYASLE